MSGDALEGAQEYKATAASAPATVADDIPAIIELAQSGLDVAGGSSFRATRTRRLAAEAINYVAYEAPVSLTGHISTLCEVLRRNQESLLQQSRAEEELIDEHIKAQRSMIKALREYSTVDTTPVARNLSPLLSLLITGDVYPSVTRMYLLVLDSCVFRSFSDVTLDLELLADSFSTNPPAVNEGVMDILASTAHHDCGLVTPWLDSVVDQLTSNPPEIRREAAGLLGVMAREQPDLADEVKAPLERRLADDALEVRIGAVLALSQIPGVAIDRYTDPFMELMASLDAEDVELRRTATDQLSDNLRAVPLDAIPVAPLIESLEMDDDILMTAASQILDVIADRDPDRVAEHLEHLVDIISTGGTLQRFMVLVTCRELVSEQPELLAPHLDTIVEQLSGIDHAEQRYRQRIQNRMSLYKAETAASPEIVGRNDTLRQDRLMTSVLSQNDIGADVDTAVASISSMIVMQVADVSPESVADSLGSIIVGLEYDSQGIRRRTLLSVLSLTQSQPSQVFPYLGYIIDTAIIAEEDEPDFLIRLIAFVILHIVLHEADMDTRATPDDIDTFFQLLTDVALDPEVSGYERRFTIRIFSNALMNRVLYGAVREQLDENKIGGVEGGMIDMSFDSVPTSDLIEQVDAGFDVPSAYVSRLIELGHNQDLQIQIQSTRSLRLLAYADSQIIASHLPEILRWLPEDGAGLETPSRDEIEDIRGMLSEETPEEHRERLLELVTALQEDTEPVELRAGIASLCERIAIRHPEALLPEIDTLRALGRDPEPSVSRPALSAIEEIVTNVPSLGDQFVDVASYQLARGDSHVQERATHVLSHIADASPQAITDEAQILISTIRTARSEATLLFAAWCLRQIAAIEPAAIGSYAYTLVDQYDNTRRDTARCRDFEYDEGHCSQMLSEDPSLNRREIRRILRSTVCTMLESREGASEWSVRALLVATELDGDIPELAATELRTRLDAEDGTEQLTAVQQAYKDDADSMAPEARSILEPALDAARSTPNED